MTFATRARRWLARNAILVYVGLAFTYLFLPVVLVMAFSFNDIQGRFNFAWRGFTLKWWESFFFGRPFGGVPGLIDSLLESARLALLSAFVATALGTLIALAMVRYRFRGRAITNTLLFLPMATPEVVMGSAVLALFVTLEVSRGFGTLLIAHILFNISFCVLILKARLQGYDRHLEEAAMDLYADEWTTFRKVTLPMIAPGIFAAFLLAFALSFDDFIISDFNSGQIITFPLYIWGAARIGVRPEVNVLGTLIFFVTVSVMLLVVFRQNRGARGEGRSSR